MIKFTVYEDFDPNLTLTTLDELAKDGTLCKEFDDFSMGLDFADWVRYRGNLKDTQDCQITAITGNALNRVLNLDKSQLKPGSFLFIVNASDLALENRIDLMSYRSEIQVDWLEDKIKMFFEKEDDIPEAFADFEFGVFRELWDSQERSGR